MSLTTTTTQAEAAVSPAVVRLLADYELHHSGNESAEAISSEQPCLTETRQAENPAWWPTDHRRVPPYRPINRELDTSLRPNGLNAMEAWFVATMLGGVTFNAHTAVLWGQTGGKVFENLFKYPIGGER